MCAALPSVCSVLLTHAIFGGPGAALAAAVNRFQTLPVSAMSMVLTISPRRPRSRSRLSAPDSTTHWPAPSVTASSMVSR